MAREASTGVRVTVGSAGWPAVAAAASRIEDPRLVTGAGRYLANQPLPAGCLHAVLIRSEAPSGRITMIDADAALAVDGVIAVLDAGDLSEVLGPFPNIVQRAPDYLPLADELVRYVGEPVAVVLGRTASAALDGANEVVVEIEPLPVVAGPNQALHPTAHRVHDSLADNVVWERAYRYGDPDAAFRAADRVVRVSVTFPRYNSTPLETFAVVARWSHIDERYDIDATFQGPFSLMGVLARGLRVREDQVRLRVPEDVGGSFGIKAMVYPYVALIAACARVVGRPVAWFEQRSEHLVGSASGTERLTDVEVAVMNDGEVLAIRTDIVEDVGAYLRAPEPSCVMRSLTLFSGPYRIEHGETHARLVLTNRLPTGLNRGYGGQQHSFTLERVMDAVARELQMDPVELRRRNLLRRDELPHTTAAGTLYDSGDYLGCLDLALERSGYADIRALQASACDDPAATLIGVGVVTAIHSAAANIGYVTLALTPEQRAAPGYRHKSGARDTAEVALLPSGRVRVRIATAGAGQGHATTAAQIAAGVLGVPVHEIDTVDVLDTADALWGVTSGSYSSRFSVVVGGAVARAATQLRERLIEVGAALLEADVGDLEIADGRVVPRDAPQRALSLRTIAGAAQWDQSAFGVDGASELACTASYSPPNLGPPDSDDRINAAATYGFMADVAVVEIDQETGKIRVRKYVAVHDVGRALNPVLIEGQIAGGILHGVAGALFEHVGYDDEGYPTNSSLMTYLCPAASEGWDMDISHHDEPSPFNDLGVKGCGENSAMSAPAAIAAAVEDALRPFGVLIDHLPLAPEQIWKAIRAGSANGSATEGLR